MNVSEYVLLAVASIIAGAIASVSGFGIGSILTPTVSLWFDARLAVAAISIPHVIGTALRFAMLKAKVDRRVMATATAIALFVDGARMPAYFYTHGEALRQMASAIAVSTAGVIAGTVFGHRVLQRIPEVVFRRVVAVLLVALGVALLWTRIGV